MRTDAQFPRQFGPAIVMLRHQLPPDVAPPGSHPIKFEIHSIDMEVHGAEKSVFLAPN